MFEKRLNLLKGYFAGMVVETDLELVKDTFAAKDIESNSKPFRKSNRSNNLPFADMERKTVDISGDETSITNHNHLG